MRKARVTTKSNYSGRYKSFDITFKDDKHFSNWYAKVSRHAKVIGVEWYDSVSDKAIAQEINI